MPDCPMGKHFFTHALAAVFLAVAATAQAQSHYEPYAFSTLAGSALNVGSNDNTGALARFDQPWDLAVDGTGTVYVADTLNHTIRKITAGGVVTTLAGVAGTSGFTNGAAGTALFNRPTGVAVDGAGNVLVADYNNHVIRRISGGVVTTLAGSVGVFGTNDGTSVSAKFRNPFGVAVNNAGTMAYVADQNNQTIRTITVPGGVVTTLAGAANAAGTNDGANSVARFNTPRGIALDSSGNLYVADAGNLTLRRILAGGGVSTLAGAVFTPGFNDGVGSNALFSTLQAMSPFGGPCGVAVDNATNVYVTDQGNHTIRKINPTGNVTTLAGLPLSSGSSDGTASAARFNDPAGVAADALGRLYVADTLNHTIRVGVTTNWNPCVPAPANMVLWLPFDETSGTASANLASGGIPGTQVNGPAVTNGFVANSLSFDGVSQSVAVPSYSAINFGVKDFSMDAWVKRAAASGNSPPRILIDKRDPLAVVGYSLSVSYGNLLFQMGGLSTGYSNFRDISTLPADDQWHFVAVTVNRTATNGGRFYLDGYPTGTFDPTGHPDSLDNTNTFIVGNTPQGGAAAWLGGIDEVELFNRALKPDEITTIFNAGPAGKCKKSPCHTPLVFTNCPVPGQWTATGSLLAGRASHHAVLLPDGMVLVTGGDTSVEVYDPNTELWMATGPLNAGGFGQTLTLLPNGKVLIAGGGHLDPMGGFFPSVIPHADAEVYDPATGLWTLTSPLNTAREGAKAVLLNNGLVLVAGGWNGNTALTSAELYNPGAGTWTPTGPLNTARVEATVTLLANGHVLVAGGSSAGGPLLAILSPPVGGAEEYDPGTGAWTSVGALNTPRSFPTATRLPNGQVLIAGGWNGTSSLSTAELYSPGAETWALTAPLNTARYIATATLLVNGQVLVAGGSAAPSSDLASAELYDPVAGTWTPTASLNTARGGATATALNDGQVLVAGGGNGPLASAEIYGRANLGCNPASIPGYDPTIDVAGGGVTMSYNTVDTTNGCTRTRTITYLAVDACGDSNTFTQTFIWRANGTPPVMTCATNKTVECGSCSGAFNFTVLHAFMATTNDGSEAHASLTQASDGRLYGVTALGGSSGQGTVFSINPDGSGYTLLKSFTGNDGASPYRGLIEGTDSLLYGTTKFGGNSGNGTVFRMAKDASFYQVLVHFNIGNGSHPWASLLQASDGLLYGTTYDGGYGNIFKLNPDGTGFSVIHNFATTDGGHPTSGLVEGNGGVLFGTTTAGGGSAWAGTVYKINKDGSGFLVLKVLGGSDGDTALAGLTLSSDGFLYGTTAYGGVYSGMNGNGTIFKLKQDGTGFTVLRAFASVNDGRVSYSTLVEGLDGTLWGTSSEGYYTSGSIFRIKKDGSDYRIVKNMGGTSGGAPIQGLLRGADGAFYGTASESLSGGGGTVFKLTCASLWDFDEPTAVDACSGTRAKVSVLRTETNASEGCSQVITRTWLATDQCGNSNTCSQTVTVADTTPPLIIAASDKVMACGQKWNFDPPAVMDACSHNTITILSTVTNGVCPRAITRTWQATDLCGNRSTCSQTVTLLDTEPPMIACPKTRIIVALDANCQLEIPTVRPPASDDCTPASLLVYTQDPPAGTIVSGPCQSVVVTVRDACGHVSLCQVLVCGQDNTPPTLIYPKAVSVTNCLVPNVLALVSASDNCTPSNKLVFTQSPPAGTAVAAGGNLVTVTVTDQEGNTTSHTIPLINSGPQSFLPALFNTAVDNSKAVLPLGTVDPHYTLGPVPVGTPTGPGYYNAPDAVVGPMPWLPPFAGTSKWIGPSGNWSRYPDGLYFYTNRFTLPPGVDPLTASISGRWTTDTGGEMYFNGSPIPVSSVPSPPFASWYAHWTYFTIPSGFQGFPAVNQLSFAVHSTERLTALRVEFTDAAANCSTCTPPAIVHKTPSQSMPLNSTAVFNVSVWGTPPFTIQWYHNGLPLANNGHYSGVDTPTLIITPLDYADAGNYYVVVSNPCGETRSNHAILSITHGWPWWWAWWNFSQIGNPMKAAVGPDLIRTGTNGMGIASGTTYDFDLPNVGGKIADVMYVPPLPADTYIRLPFVAPPGADTVSNYTVIMDVFLPSNTTGRALFFDIFPDLDVSGDRISLSHAPGAAGNVLGVSGTVGGTPFGIVQSPVPGNDMGQSWTRLALVINHTPSSMGQEDVALSLYVNGLPACSTVLNAMAGAGAFRSNSLATVCSSPEGTGNELYVSSIQFHACAMTPEMIAGIGSPGDGPTPANDTSAGAQPVLNVSASNALVNLSWTGSAFRLRHTMDLISGVWMDSMLPFDEREVNGDILTTGHVTPPPTNSSDFYRLIYRP